MNFGFETYPEYPLISLFSPVAFFAAAILSLLVSLFDSLMKGKSQRFLRSLVRYRVRLSAFHIGFKVGV